MQAFTFIIICALLLSEASTSTESQTIKEMLRNYELTPPDGKVRVQIDTYVRSFEYVSSEKMEYKVQLTFRQRWNDPRLNHSSDSIYVNLDADKVWTPDLFFSNERMAYEHLLMRPNTLLRVFRGGDVLLSKRVSLVLSCPMDLRHFPFDSQTCAITIASWGITSDKLGLSWTDSDSIQRSLASTFLSEFYIGEVRTATCDTKTVTGSYSCLRADFSLERKVSRYLVTCYIPGSMFVIISLLSFWISSSTNRMTLLMFDLMGATALIYASNQSFPVTNYTKAVDVFTGISLTFIMAALIEFVVVQRRPKREVAKEKVAHYTPDEIKENTLDSIFRIMMPCVFGTFAVIYFSVMLLI